MKLNSHAFFIFLLFVFFVCLHSEARLLDAQHEKANHDEIIQHEDSFIRIEDDLSDLMGSGAEECNEEDEECLKRRMITEAHLDYIYTQHHKP